ncbi:hypothetical protein LCGC14_2677900 [marine sediment metagenome]|uniref:Uncharacterized protein n=1 Tax=marine sediment metagenome TaxID=412755 RepID=A0A0F8ZM96_9ZZZZ
MTTTAARVKTVRRRAKKRGLRLYKCRGADVVANRALYVLTDDSNRTVFGGSHQLSELTDVEKYLRKEQRNNGEHN